MAIIWIQQSEPDAEWYAEAIKGALKCALIVKEEFFFNVGMNNMRDIAGACRRSKISMIGLVDGPQVCGSKGLGLIFCPNGGKARSRNYIIYNPKGKKTDRDDALMALLKELKERKLANPLI